jgi:hypothetical protein
MFFKYSEPLYIRNAILAIWSAYLVKFLSVDGFICFLKLKIRVALPNRVHRATDGNFCCRWSVNCGRSRNWRKILSKIIEIYIKQIQLANTTCKYKFLGFFFGEKKVDLQKCKFVYSKVMVKYPE